MTRDDRKFMGLALDLAVRGGASVLPNPQVGAVVVRDGRIVGEGYHRKHGGPHAEVFALRRAKGRAKGATLFVTLEPCVSHRGKKTPPCSALVARSGVKRVVIAMKDPNPAVGGRGIAALRKAGVKVTTGVLAGEARAINEPFVKACRVGLAFWLACWYMYRHKIFIRI